MTDEGQESMNISFLCGHVMQLIQSISQFAFNPGEEDIKRKGWWQFWKRGHNNQIPRRTQIMESTKIKINITGPKCA